MTGPNEAQVEAAAVSWLAELGWSVAHGSEVNPESAPLERADYSAVVKATTTVLEQAEALSADWARAA